MTLQPNFPEYRLHVIFVNADELHVGVNSNEENEAQSRGLAIWRKLRGDKLKAQLQKRQGPDEVWVRVKELTIKDLEVQSV